MGKLPYDFKTVGMDSYELKFLVRIDNATMRLAFDKSLREYRKKHNKDIDGDLDDRRLSRFFAPPHMHSLLNTGMNQFWKNAKKNIYKNSKKRVALISRRIPDQGVIYERQDDGSWACLIKFVGEFVDGR